MKNKNFISVIFSVALCTATLILTNGDQNIETRVPDKLLQNFSLESSQDHPFRTTQVFPPRENVTEETTENVPESVTDTSPVTKSTDDESSTEPMEATYQDDTTKFSVLPKRYAITPTPDDFSEPEVSLEESYLDSLTLDRLESYSCMEEASGFGHKEASGVLLHEVICEFRKLWHYFMIAVQNIQNELQLDLPIETEEAMILLSDFVMSGAVFDKIEQGIVHLEVFLENPENLNVLLDVIEKCVPMSNIHETVNRIRIAISNFFVHLQGFVIYFEPHAGIQNYIELLKKWEEKLGAAAETILSLFDIHLETEMHLLLEFASSLRSLLRKLSFAENVEYNLTVLKEFIDSLNETWKQYHASDSSKSVISYLQTVISSFISTFLPGNIDIPIIQFLLPNKDIATLSFIWQIINGTSPNSPSIPLSQNVTSICSTQLLDIFEKEAELLSEFSSLATHAFAKLCLEQTFEERLVILKDSIDQLLNIYRKYLEFSGFVIDKVHTFILNLFSTDFNIPLLHFKTANGTAILSFIWQVRDTTSRFPLISPAINITSIFRGVTINWSELLPGSIAQVIASSNSIQRTETSKLPIAIDGTVDVISSASKTTVSSASGSIIQSPASISNLLTPNDGSQRAIHSTTSAINSIIQPINYGSSVHYSSQSKPTTSLPFALPSDVFSSLPNVKSNDISDPLRTTSLPSSSTTIQTDAPYSHSSTTKIPNIPGITSSHFSTPFGTTTHNNRQPPVSSPSGKTNDISRNNLIVPSLFANLPNSLGNNLSTPSSDPKKPADNPPISSPTTQRTTDPLTNNPTTPSSSSERPTDLLTTNPAIPSSVPEKPANILDNNSQMPSAISDKPADSMSNNPSTLSPSPTKLFNLLSNNTPTTPASPERPTDLSSNNSPTATSAKPTDSMSNTPSILSPSPTKLFNLLSNNTPTTPASPERPTDLSSNNSPTATSAKPTDSGINNSPIPSLVPGRPMDLLTNTPQTSPSPINTANLLANTPPIPSFVNNPSTPSSVPGESVDPLTRPGDSSVNNPPLPPFMFERPGDSSVNNPPLPPFMFERPADYSVNDPLIPPTSFGRPTEFSDYNTPNFAPSSGRPVDFAVNNPLIYPYNLRRPVGFSNDAPIYLSSYREFSPSILFLNERDGEVERGYNEPANPYTPPDYLIPASNIVPNLPRYQPVSSPYVNYLESADAFYKSLYSYLQYGNPAISPPPNVSDKISEFLRRGLRPSLPMSMDNPNPCGTSTSLPSLSALNSILKNDMKRLHLPLYLPRKEIASALGNTILSPGDLIVILPKNGFGLIGQVIDAVSPIFFKAYEMKTAFTNSQNGIKIWHLRSKDFRNPECERQLEFLFQHKRNFEGVV